jgi:hypothetical protein
MPTVFGMLLMLGQSFPLMGELIDQEIDTSKMWRPNTTYLTEATIGRNRQMMGDAVWLK